MVRSCCIADPCSLRRATGCVSWLRRLRLLLRGLLGGGRLLLCGGPQLLGHRLWQLHRKWGPHRQRRVTATNNGVRQGFSRLIAQRVDGLLRPVHDAADHPPVTVDADEPDDTGRRRADHFPAPWAVLDPYLRGVLAQRVGQLRGDFPPQRRTLRRGVRRDGEPAVGCHHPHRARHASLGQLHLHLAGLGHRDEHRAQIQPGHAPPPPGRRSRRCRTGRPARRHLRAESAPPTSSSKASSSGLACLPKAITNSHVRRRNRGRRRHGKCRPSRPHRTRSPRPVRVIPPAAPAAGRSDRHGARRWAARGRG